MKSINASNFYENHTYSLLFSRQVNMRMCEALQVMSDEGANKKLEERNMSTIPFETHPDWLLVNEKSISQVNRLSE